MEDELWKPPTEAELKVIKAKRERSDKISHVMGQYLLKGYRMLSTCCDSCGTILLQDRQQQLYCVACTEIDNEHSKDDPALNGEAARRQIEESGHRTSLENLSNSTLALETQQNLSQTNVQHPKVPVLEVQPSTSCAELNSDNSMLIYKSEKTVRSTMSWAVDSLEGCRCADSCIKYCNLVKSCADALISLKQIQRS